MKRVRLLVAVTITLIVLSAHAQSDTYYYYKDKKIPLETDYSRKFILYDSSLDTIELRSIINVPDLAFNNVGMYDGLHGVNRIKTDADEIQKWAFITSEQQLDKQIVQCDGPILYESCFFKATPESKSVGVSQFFYVKLRTEEDVNKLSALAESNNVEIIGNDRFMPLWYILSCTKQTDGNALEMANFFYETSLFEAAEPDFMIEYKPTCVNDTYFSSQWNLNNTGQHGDAGIDINYCLARQITLGNPNIIVAVLDDGLELNHPDLANVCSISYDTETGTSPSQVYGSHGTACAGIIGANPNNNLGVAGIAPNCQIMSISNSMSDIPVNASVRLANGINIAWQNGASVISNSWGSNDLQPHSYWLDNAISNALIQGRDGLGCVVVFATGNDNSSVSYPANSNPDIIAVGAMSPCGERMSPTSCAGWNWGSNFGASLDIMAPGVLIPTTDRQGSYGYNNAYWEYADYTMDFNGTSSACPHVAAVAALILSINPYLTQSEVADIIESTAQKVGGYNYASVVGRPNGTWNNQMGYGLVDAYAAVVAAQTTHFSNEIITTNTTVRGYNVEVEDVFILEDKLTIDALNDVIINGYFYVAEGAEFEVK